MFWQEPFFRRPTLSGFGPGSRLQDVFEQVWPTLRLPRALGFGAEHRQSAAALNIWRQPDRVRIAVWLPGVAEDAIDLEVEQQVLTLRVRPTPPAKSTDAPAEQAAQPTPAEPTVLRQERAAAAALERQVQLPFPVQADAVSARARHGILWIDLPRAEADKPRKIAVQSPAE